MFCPETLQHPPVPSHLRARRSESLLSTFPTSNKVCFLHSDQKKCKTRPKPCDAAPQDSGFSVRPRTTNHIGVPESKACPHTMKQVCDGSTGGNHLGRAGTVLTWRRRENKRLSHFIPGSKLCVEHIPTQTQMICCLCHEARSTEHVKHILPCHVFVNNWICNRFLKNTAARNASVSLCFGADKRENGVTDLVFFISCRVLKPRIRSMPPPS